MSAWDSYLSNCNCHVGSSLHPETSRDNLREWEKWDVPHSDLSRHHRERVVDVAELRELIWAINNLAEIPCDDQIIVKATKYLKMLLDEHT